MNIINTTRNFGITLALSVPGIVFAQGLGGDGNVSFEGTAGGDLVEALTNIINALLVLAAIFAAIFLVLGGVRYITSQGNQDQVDQAKNTILYAVIGLIVIGLAAAIVNFVVGAIA